MGRATYEKPEVIVQQSLVFETMVSSGIGDFPGLGLGVGGEPSNLEGEGQFPGNGNGYGWKKRDAGH